MIDNSRLLRLRSSSPAASSPATSRLIPSLPDDLAILCIARVPRSHHHLLAAVSRAWRALIRSPLLFSVRLEVGASEHFLFIDFYGNYGESRHWYILDRCLCRNHSASLIPLPVPPLPSITGYSSVSLGHSLYLIGGSIDGKPSSAVQIYDARFNSWHLGARRFDSRQFDAVGVISGRIYAVGGCPNISEYWAEEFDPEKDQWKRISNWSEFREKQIHENAFIGGKLLVVFDPSVYTVEAQVTQDKAWRMFPMSLYLSWRGKTATVGEVVYGFTHSQGKLRAYDFAKGEWRVVKGVDKELPNFLPVKLANFGEECWLAWTRRRGDNEMEVIVTGVRVTKTDTGGLRGSVEWSKMFVLAYPEETIIAHCNSLEF